MTQIRLMLSLFVLSLAMNLPAQEVGKLGVTTGGLQIAMQVSDGDVVKVPRGSVVFVRVVNESSLVVRWKGKTGTIPRRGVLSLAEAEKHFTLAVKQAPTASNYVTRAYIRFDNSQEEEALEDFNLALKLDPESERAYVGRGTVRLWKAGGNEELDEQLLQQALTDFSRALQLQPKSVDAHMGRASAWAMLDSLPKALVEYEKALKFQPDFAEVIGERGALLASYGQYEKALADYRKAIKLDPDDFVFYRDLAWLQAACPEATFRDGKLAVKNATRACELSVWKDDFAVSTLAAAYAEDGDFDMAVKWQLRAIELASTEAKEQYRFCLEHMKKGQPCRDVAL